MDTLQLIITLYFMVVSGTALILMLFQYREDHYTHILHEKSSSDGQACDKLVDLVEEEKTKRKAAEEEMTFQSLLHRQELTKIKAEYEAQLRNAKNVNKAIASAAVRKGSEQR